MKPRTLIVGIVIVAVVFHLGLAKWSGNLSHQQTLTTVQRDELRRQLVATTQQLEAARQCLAVISAAKVSAKAQPLSKTPGKAKNPHAIKGAQLTVVIAGNPELRKMSVEVYVDQRRLAFAGLLKRLGFTDEQRQRFDQIQAEYQQGQLDLALAASAQGWDRTDPSLAALRAQLVQRQATETQDLFGANASQWTAANRALGVQQFVSDIMQENIQGAAALNGAVADSLTQILLNNQLREHAGQLDVDPTGYDWDAVLNQARAVLTAQLFEGLKSSLNYYRARTAMAMIASKAEDD